jgi:hypothetical protein
MVGFVDESSEQISTRIQINPSEVELYFWVPLEFFLTAKPVQEYDIPWQGEIFVFREYLFSITNPSAYDGGTKEIPITGLTASVARSVAEIALPNYLPSVTERSLGVVDHRGLLWRLQDHAAGSISTRSNSGKTKEAWSRKYFILSGGTLHQYDNRQMAERKSQSASKKNRLKLLNDDSVHLQDVAEMDGAVESHHNDGERATKSRYAFRISVLDGRVVWHLAASSPQERSHWKHLLLQSISMGT